MTAMFTEYAKDKLLEQIQTRMPLYICDHAEKCVHRETCHHAKARSQLSWTIITCAKTGERVVMMILNKADGSWDYALTLMGESDLRAFVDLQINTLARLTVGKRYLGRMHAIRIASVALRRAWGLLRIKETAHNA